MHICSRSTLLDLSNDPKVPHFSSYYTPGATAHSTYRTYTQQYSRDLADARPSPTDRTANSTRVETRRSERGHLRHTKCTSTPRPSSRPPDLARSLAAHTAASAHGAQATTAGWRGASPACMCQSYGVLPVSTCQSSLLSLKQSTAQGFLQPKFRVQSLFELTNSKPTFLQPKHTRQNCQEHSPDVNCGRCRCWGRPR